MASGFKKPVPMAREIERREPVLTPHRVRVGFVQLCLIERFSQPHRHRSSAALVRYVFQEGEGLADRVHFCRRVRHFELGPAVVGRSRDLGVVDPQLNEERNKPGRRVDPRLVGPLRHMGSPRVALDRREGERHGATSARFLRDPFQLPACSRE